MTEPIRTMKEWFSAEEAGDDAAREPLGNHDKIRELDEKLDAKPGEVRPGAASEKVAASLGDVMEVDIVEDILIKVWNEGKLFQKYLDPEMYPAEETIEVTLAKHEVSSVHNPYIEIRFDEAKVDRIDFEITFGLQLKGALVEIKGGRILKVRMGEVTGSGEVKCEGFKLFSRKSAPVRLPGVVEFEDGVTIAA